MPVSARSNPSLPTCQRRIDRWRCAITRSGDGSNRRVGPVLVALVALACSAGAAGAASPTVAGPPSAIGVDLDRSVGAGAGAEADCRHPWVAPVDAEVVDPFRPPDGPYGPGNRGIEYGTEPGQPVVAIDGGVVDFAGPVAGHPVVVINHGAGLRSSYVNLLDRSVNRGQSVERGQPIARADTAFHLGVRQDGFYLDPAPLLGQLCEIVRLVALPSG